MDVIDRAGTVFWNGPVGLFEDARFAAGTRALAESLASAGGFTVVGGGDVVAAIDGFGLEDKIDFVSTGGGAALELLGVRRPPGTRSAPIGTERPERRGSRVTPERGALISGNWKMNENHFEALKLVQELAALLLQGAIPAGREVSIHPPFTSLRTVQTALETDHVPVALGA